MQIASFLPHYQLVCISFDISSFSLISYTVISVTLQGKVTEIAKQADKSENIKSLFPVPKGFFLLQVFTIGSDHNLKTSRLNNVLHAVVPKA